MTIREVRISVDRREGRDGILNVLEVSYGAFGDHTSGRLTIEFEHVGVHSLSPVSLLDGYVFGVMPFAMRGAERLRVQGPVSRAAIRNGWELGEAWHAWLPGEYFPVEVVPDETWDEAAVFSRSIMGPRTRAIAAFSGGVDSTFTALRHTFDMPNAVSHNLTDLCMVHGFDVRLDNPSDFEGLLRRTGPLVDAMDLNLRVVRTNLREATQPNWEHAHGMHLACVLHQFAGDHYCGLIASGDSDYVLPPIAWGSSPLTNHLMSGAEFQIISDGGGHSRSEKVALISQHPEAESSIKVCYSGTRKDRNCGQCFKCVRTHLLFRANGIEHPRCFDAPIRVQDVATLKPPNPKALDNLREMVTFAQAKGLRDPLFSVLQARVAALDDATSGWRGQPQVQPPVPDVATAHTDASWVRAGSGMDAGVPPLLLERLQQYAHVVGQTLAHNGPVLLLHQMPGNTGDHLIWAGTEHLLRRQGIPYGHIPVDAVVVDRGRVKGTLVIPGSGAMTRLWHEWLPGLILAASDRFDRVVILPSEYDPEIRAVRQAVSRPNVFAFARDATSFGRIKRFGQAMLAMDPALYALDFHPQDREGRSKTDETGALVALRTDAGSLLAQKNLQPCAGNDDISLSRATLTDFLDAIRSAPTAVTDRLHVVVAAVMLGKTVRYVDPYESKISRYVEFTFRDDLKNQVQQRDESWLVDHGYATALRGTS